MNSNSPTFSNTVCGRVAEQARRTPDAPAVVAGETAMSFAELEHRANALAGRLRDAGALPGTVVGICVKRSFDLPVAVLAVMKAGCTCLPLDPSYPAQRLAFMASDAGARVIAIHGEYQPLFEGWQGTQIVVDGKAGTGVSHDAASLPADGRTGQGEGLAYVLYTSGSTGLPKGVAMPHASLANLIDWHVRTVDAKPGQRTLQFTSLSFDVSFQEIFSALCSGGTLVMIDETTRRDPGGLIGFLSRQRIDHLFMPYGVLRVLAGIAAHDERPLSLRHVFTAGEQLTVDDVLRRWFEKMPDCRLHNHYGPTETHVVAAHTLDPAPSSWPVLPPIGTPIANVELHILDASLDPVPQGQTGELFIGGVCLASGYLGRDALNAERFVSNPHRAGERLYRSGDLARRNADGTLDFIGRADDQVKVRGVRVELGEIEAALTSLAGISQAVVVPRRRADETVLRAHVVRGAGAEAAALDARAIRAQLQRTLPGAMIPAEILFDARLPVTPSGKIDRHALADGDDAAAPAAGTGTAEQIAELFRQVLGHREVDLDDDFFDLGGTSLSLMHLAAAMKTSFDVEVGLGAFADGATPLQLSSAVMREKVREIFKGILELDDAADRDDFFELGGTSLTLMRLLAQLNAEFDASLELADLADGIDIESMAKVVGQKVLVHM